MLTIQLCAQYADTVAILFPQTALGWPISIVQACALTGLECLYHPGPSAGGGDGGGRFAPLSSREILAQRLNGGRPSTGSSGHVGSIGNCAAKSRTISGRKNASVKSRRKRVGKQRRSGGAPKRSGFEESGSGGGSPRLAGW